MSTPRVDTGSTASRLLRLVWPVSETDARVVSHNQLMDESQRRLYSAVHCGVPVEETVATRILGSAREFHRWEDQHACIMKRIAGERHCEAQKAALLDASLALIHRKALFEHLRDAQVRGQRRRHLMAIFCGHHDYETAVISEHGIYLRSAASFLCSSHVGRRLLFDEIFNEPLAQYEDLYGEYFRAFCNAAVLSERSADAALLRPLVMSLKRQVSEYRAALLALTQSNSGTWRRPVFPAD
jgi:hypothetical protein